jgi:hypothetical protein
MPPHEFMNDIGLEEYILKSILEKQNGVVWIGSIWLRIRTGRL